jgi:imidazoleglycerol phosphate synthase glutamine amidotransferase subunit HisH
MILVVKVNEHKLHDDEFVKPLTDLLDDFRVVDYNNVELEGVDKVIICGTALKDNKYLEGDFSWLKDCKIPVLGICAGMQIIGKVLGHELIKDKRIGVFDNKYYLHSFRVDGFGDSLEKDNFKGLLFHPEVLGKEIIKEFSE